MEYLKKHLSTNIPAVVVMKKRLKPVDETDYKTKQLTGKKQYPYAFILNGVELMHYASEAQEQSLSLFKEGETLQVVIQEKKKADGKSYKIYVWTPIDGAEARSAATPQPQSNTATARSQEKADTYKQTEEAKWKRIDTSKIIFGYMKECIALGKDGKEAATVAYDYYQYQEATVNKILSTIYPPQS